MQKVLYIYTIEIIKLEIMTNQEIKTQAFKIVKDLIVLKHNVKNGCYSDRKELTEKEARLEGIKAWLKENDMLNDVFYMLNNNSLKRNMHFEINDLITFFNA